jgi:hypothetical protein
VSVETKETPESEGLASPAIPAAIRERMQFYRIRHKIYTGLLLFVVVAGLPVVGVPFLRHRLGDRVQVLKLAITGGYSIMVTAKVGENREPFPQEYEHAVPHRNYPQLPAYLNSILSPSNVSQVYAPLPARKSKAAPEPQAAAEITPKQTEQQIQQAQQTDVPAQDAEPVYRQGKIEQEVYDVLLKSDASVAGLVQDKNPSFRFKTWDVAKREEDLYWVRIIFTQMPAKTDMECIWQVQLMSKQVMPLNFNARSLPRS